MRLVLVTRQGCHLCDQALDLLRGLGHEPELADVDADDRVVAEGKITLQQLEKAVGKGSS